MPSGRAAIDDAFDALYPTEVDHRFAGAAGAGGKPKSIEEFAAFPARASPIAHWHYVTYGLTDIAHRFEPSTGISGLGFELTFRLRRSDEEKAPPTWPLRMMTTIADYIRDSGNKVSPMQALSLPGRTLFPDGQLACVLFVADPELPPVESANGRVAFLQVVGITEDEEDLLARWDAREVSAALADGNPLLVTDPARASLLADPARGEALRARARVEGSRREVEFLPDLRIEQGGEAGAPLRVHLDAAGARVIARALEARTACGKPLRLEGDRVAVTWQPSPLASSASSASVASAGESSGNVLVTITLPQAAVPTIAGALRAGPGSYAWPWLPGLMFVRSDET